MNAKRVPLAWSNLTHDWRKLSLAISGIAFAVMLMFQQRGFNHALFDSMVALVKHLNADLVVFSNARFSLSAEIRFRRDILDMARSSPMVADADPIYMENTAAMLRSPGERARPIRVIAFDLDRPVYLDPYGRFADLRSKLAKPRTAVIDRLSKRNYGVDLNADFDKPQQVELANRSLQIVDTFTMGRDFANDGNLIMSLDSFVHYFPFRRPAPDDVVDLGIIRCQPGVSPENAKADLIARLPPEVTVMTRDEYVRREVRFWARNTPIGIIFTLGSIMGFVVGVIICYQVLANDIAEHLSEFATLKAMGYSTPFFVQIVIRQSLYLSAIGFVIGLAMSLILFRFIEAATGLLMVMTVGRALVILVLTVLMCIVSGMLAMRKLLLADPATLFV